MKKSVLIVIVWLSMLPVNGYSQSFWSLTEEFWGGAKTGIVLKDDTVLFAGLSTGIIKSTNEGKNFVQVLSASAVSSVFLSSAGRLYAGGTGTVYTSDNNGASWDSVALNSVYPVKQFAETGAGAIFAITGMYDEGDGVFCSEDGGQNWEQRNNGLGSFTGGERLAADKNGRLYLAVSDENTTGNGGLFISENNGQLWEKIVVLHDSIPTPIKPGHITGLSISPDDTLYFSFTGTAANYYVEMNLSKSINDLKSDTSWQVMPVGTTLQWWNSRALNNIHFAQNGDWYSSLSGTVNEGATYYSTDKGKTWERKDQGLGLSESGLRTAQQFAENSNGLIYMVQYLDERIYKTDKSLLTTTRQPLAAESRIQVLPNPVNAGGRLTVQVPDKEGNKEIALYDLSGALVLSANLPPFMQEFTAPAIAGVYFFVVKDKHFVATVKIVVK